MRSVYDNNVRGRECVKQGVAYSDTMDIDEVSYILEKDESQKASLPPSGGETLSDSRKGNTSPSLPSIDGGDLVGRKERRASHSPESREALSFPRKEGKKIENWW